MSEKVAILISAPRGGGAEKSMRLVHSEFIKRQLDSLLVSINGDSKTALELGANEVNLGRSPRANLFETLSTILKFNVLIWKFRPRTLILNGEISELLGVFGLIPGCSLIVVEHANPSWEGRRVLGMLIRKILCIRKSRYVAVSGHIKSPFPIHGYSAVIPNPIGDDISPDTHVVGNRLERLVYIGRLATVHKNPELLLQIAREVRIPVVYFGEGELRHELAEQANSLGVNVDFRGWVEEPWQELHPNDLLVIPSEHEGDGLVAVEAILRGVPVLMNNVEDLTRFNLPKHNYCSSLNEFVETINHNLFSPWALISTRDSRVKLRESRNLSSVADHWLEFISPSTI